MSAPLPEASYAAWVEIDLAALSNNLEQLRTRTSGEKIAAVLKADGYGHGAVEVANSLSQQGVDLMIVARASEAIELRNAGVTGRLLVLSPPDTATWDVCVEHNLEVTCSTPESLAFVCGVESAALQMPVHVKINTGMNRLGLHPGSVHSALERLNQASAVRPVALCSHLADADLAASARTEEQTAKFQAVLDGLASKFAGLETHLANSAGLLHHRSASCSYVRLGISLYGYDPCALLELSPVMSIHARVLQVHRLEAGDRVGYGGRWSAKEPTQVAIVGVGYGDGYPYHQNGNARVLTERGARPVVGSVSMDSLAFACPLGEAVRVGDLVTVLGERAGERIIAHELGCNAETMAYEVLLRLGRRLPRVFVN